MRCESGLAAAMAAATVTAAWAQTPADACGLMSRDEFQSLTGRTEYSEPTPMPWGEGSVCGYGNGQILLFVGPDSRGAFDRLLASFGQSDLPRAPVEGLGEDAFALFIDPDNPFQDHATTVVFGAGPSTIAVTVYAEEGEPGEAALPQAMAVAQAAAAKLP